MKPTVEETKAHLKVQNTVEDALIGMLIDAAYSHAERFLGRVFSTEYPDALPDPVKVAVIMHVGTLYLHREADTTSASVEVPFGYKMLLSSYRVYPSA